MSNDKQPSAKEILKTETEKYAECKVIYSKTHQGIINAMNEFADQQTKALHEENKKLQSWYDGQVDRNEKLQKDKGNVEGLYFQKKEDEVLEMY
jgi:hypothetical protein